MRQQCANRNIKLELDTPTVVLLVTDSGGGSCTDVQVKVDGEPFASQPDGRALPIRYFGMHDASLVLIADGRVFATQKILIVQGQRTTRHHRQRRQGGPGAVAADESAVPTMSNCWRRASAREDGAAAKRLSPRKSATAESTPSEEAGPPKRRRTPPLVRPA